VPAVPEPVLPAVPAPVVLPVPELLPVPEPVVLPVPELLPVPEPLLPAVPCCELPALPVWFEGVVGVAHPKSSRPPNRREATDERIWGAS
jgi:hypothetical protein